MLVPYFSSSYAFQPLFVRRKSDLHPLTLRSTPLAMIWLSVLLLHIERSLRQLVCEIDL